ncbi:hypothetical protein STEG23_000352 [Scotinomys teguina]
MGRSKATSSSRGVLHYPICGAGGALRDTGESCIRSESGDFRLKKKSQSVDLTAPGFNPFGDAGKQASQASKAPAPKTPIIEEEENSSANTQKRPPRKSELRRFCTIELKSKWIKDLNINPVTLNLMEKKVGSTLERIGTGDQFPNITPTAQTLSATINQWDYMKLRSFCKAKDTITKTKHQPTEWEKIFTNPTSDRGLISRIYKELKKHDIKTPDSPIEKWAIELNREFTAEEYRMVERHLRKCSTSLLIREMQIKTTLRYHLTPVRMAKIKNTGDSSCWRGCGARGTLLHCWWECRLVQPLWKAVWRILRKLGIILPPDPAIPLLGIYPKIAQSYHKDTCSTMFIAALFVIARTWKQPRCPSTEEWIRKMWYIYTMEYYAAEKNNDIMKFAGKWMELENVILSEVTQTQKDKYGIYSLIGGY